MIRNTYLALLSLSLLVFALADSSKAQTGDAITEDVQITPFAFGIDRYEPDTWSTVGLCATNNLLQDREALISVFVEPYSREQFARRLWVPARAIRVTWLPLHIPNDLPAEKEYLDLSSMRLKESASEDVLRQQAYDTLISNSVLVLDTSVSKTAVLFGKPLPEEEGNTESVDQLMYRLIVESKLDIDDSRLTIDLGGDFFPPTPFSYQALDQLFICDDRLVEDSAGMIAIRHWLQQGGRAWLPLDRVGLATLTALLGDATGCEIVSRTELNRFTIADVSRYPEPATEDVWESENPVEFLRVVTDSADVHCRIDGWPAAFWKKIGDGEILVTTLASPGFLRTQPGPTVVSQALHSMGLRFYQTRCLPAVDVNVAKPLLLQQIGYTIPSRGKAATILLFNCGLLLAAGWWLARRGRLEQLAWVAPTVALCATAAFLLMGRSTAHRVPASAASFQFVQVTPGTNSADAHTMTAIYSPTTQPLSLESQAGELVVPDVSDLSNVVKRVTWGDSGRSRWRGISLKPGTIRFVERHVPLSWNTPIRAVGQFGPLGLTGRLTGPVDLRGTDSVIVAAPSPNLAVSLNDDGTFLGRADAVLDRSHYLPNAILSDEQRRRMVVYQQLHQASLNEGYPDHPTIFTWTNTLAAPTPLDSAFQQSGSALFAIPLQIERTAPGTRFVVPATFVRPQLVRDEQGISFAYNSRSGEWVDEMTGPMRTQLRFVLPAQVVPCQLTQANVTINLIAPSRTLSLYGFRDGQRLLLHEQDNPNGTYTIPLRQAEALQLDRQGGLALSFQISGQKDVSDERTIEAYQQSSWQLKYVRVDVEGQTLE